MGRVDEGAGAELTEGGFGAAALQLVRQCWLLGGLALLYTFISLSAGVAPCTVHICWRPDL